MPIKPSSTSLPLHVTPTFLYPKSRQFPFDALMEQMVRELEKRNWKVPGITVEFNTYGSGHNKFRMVSKVRGDNFVLHFCRKQASLAGGRWNDVAAINEMLIPGMELHVYEDESGPTFIKYVGKNWQKDKARWFSSSKIHSKMNGEPRWYLRFKGSERNPKTSPKKFDYTYSGRRPTYLVVDNDLGREYANTALESDFYTTKTVFQQFQNWIEANVLKVILKTPVATTKIEMFTQPKDIPVPARFSTLQLWTKGDGNDAHRILQGQAALHKLLPDERYGLLQGQRLVSLGVHNDGTVKDIAYNGFIWCGIGAVDRNSVAQDMDVPGWYLGSSDAKYVFRVKLKRANDVYVIDYAPQKEYRKKVFSVPGHTEMTNTEYNTYQLLPARSLVPLVNYDGSYKLPVVLIGRELDLDELEVVSGKYLQDVIKSIVR